MKRLILFAALLVGCTSTPPAPTPTLVPQVQVVGVVPQFVAVFATAWCAGDAAIVYPLMGVNLAGRGTQDGLAAAFASRESPCKSMEYLGSGTRLEGPTFYIYVEHDAAGDLWWVYYTSPDEPGKITWAE